MVLSCDVTSTRRQFLASATSAGLASVVAACTPSGTSAPASQPADSTSIKTGFDKAWDELVGAANQEGNLALVTTVGAVYRDAVDEFQKAFPGIKVDHTSLNASQFAPRVVQERNGGIYSYDVAPSTFGTLHRTLMPMGGLDPIRPFIIRPDALDDKTWRDGSFEAGLLDTDRKYSYASFQIRSRHLWINTDLVKDGEIKTVQDLLDPKWKGQILSLDLRVAGSYWPATVMRLAYGDDIIKRLWKDQEAVLNRELRQITEMMVRGKYAIGIDAPIEFILPEFLDQGLGKNLKFLELDNVEHVSGGNDVLFLFNRAPHPNAAKVFINWVLSKEGSATWSKLVGTNSRRVDVEPYALDNIPSPGRKYIQIDKQELQAEWEKTQELAKQALN